MKEAGKNFGVYEGDKLINKWHGQGNAEDWVAGQKANYKDYGNYESSHFDEPNILAHMRVTDRTIDGKKTLFVEEIQSDWHQSGRKKGYKTPIDFESKIRPLTDQEKEITGASEGVMMQKPDGVWGYMPNREQAMDYLIKKEGYKVPDAPFKKNWQELTMKRAMQMAAEGGYDRVAFTTGKQQAERYNLSKQVEKINWMPYESNGSTKVVRIQPNNGNTIELRLSPEGAVMNGGQFEGKTIDEVIGKDIAKKIMDESKGDLSGVNLDIGGEGMKGFYDKILPDFINKYGKKHGLKVGQTSLKAGRDTGNFNEFVDWAATQDTGIPMNRGELMTLWERYKEGQNVVLVDRYMKSGADQSQNVHYFDLTPEAKESFLKKGQPLFAVPPALAITDEDSQTRCVREIV